MKVLEQSKFDNNSYYLIYCGSHSIATPLEVFEEVYFCGITIIEICYRGIFLPSKYTRAIISALCVQKSCQTSVVNTISLDNYSRRNEDNSRKPDRFADVSRSTGSRDEPNEERTSLPRAFFAEQKAVDSERIRQVPTASKLAIN